MRSDLKHIIDPETGFKVIRNVFLKKELGINSYNFPELVLMPNSRYEIMDYNANGNLYDNVYNRPGEHGLYGLFISNFKPETNVENVWEVGKLIKREVL